MSTENEPEDTEWVTPADHEDYDPQSVLDDVPGSELSPEVGTAADMLTAVRVDAEVPRLPKAPSGHGLKSFFTEIPEYDRDVAGEYLARLAAGQTLQTACGSGLYPYWVFREWRRMVPEFNAQVEAAWEERGEAMLQKAEALALADGSEDVVGDMARAKVLMGIARMRSPKKYGGETGGGAQANVQVVMNWGGGVE